MQKKGNSIMTLSEMKARKKELGLTNEMIAEKAGIPLSSHYATHPSIGILLCSLW